ncbi:hypothetical protein PENARI_c006G11033 [Penicillium arizonense]|uniref:Zn(2)-C6 fungal-type domain-containing protein n=1 Tax=Penicillium arizonense TaxID=1835702 RepID=A0A1F5LMQ9_PENAI|nr:hypothetical protein PENARI_c006G11033 [Penicillium arizonense]OGE54407.1 hypothetical protein PENARI_c006G11033 [Penicillium arizonense]
MPRRGPKKPVKRSKTFTGCWTCRSRGVKCGEEKPACVRCSKGSFHCEGYGVKLVWPDEYNRNPTGAQRRLFTQLQECEGPTLSEVQLDISLETLDAAIVVDQEQDGPFSVFRLPSSRGDVAPEHLRLWADVESSNLSILRDGVSPLAGSHSKDSSMSTILREVNDNQDDNLDTILVTSNWPPETPIIPETGHASVNRCRSSPRLQDYVASEWSPWTEDSINHFGLFGYPEPREDRELMHYWITHLSDLMISVGYADNPYRAVWVPMALQSMAGKHTLLENSALLHAIYALSAFNKSQRVEFNTLSGSMSAIKHYQLSLSYLRQASTQRRETQLEVVLAVISALSLMEVISGNFSFWRGHLKGGRGWLHSIEQGKWTHLQKSMTYQFFLFTEVIGSTIPEAAATTVAKATHAVCDSDYVYDPTFGVTSMFLETDYVLDQYYGITKPILEAIIHINHLSTSLHRPSEIELEGLEIKIRLNKPMSASNKQGILGPERLVIMDYQMVFYHACYIHFKHSLLHTLSEDLQGTVRQSLLHLRNIEIHELTSGYCGILWPMFVVACEADESKSRNAFFRWFATKSRLGIGSVSLALAVVLEVWRRRDTARVHDKASCFVSWGKVMAEMGLDLFII